MESTTALDASAMPGQRSAWHPEPPKVARKPAKPKGVKRQREYRVNVRETHELHAYRAQAAVWVRYLPLKLQGPMFAHVIMADIDGDACKYSWEKAAAWSKVIAPRYKLPAVGGLRQFRTNSGELREMGLIFYDLDVTETYLDHDGKVRGNRLNEFDVDMMALEMRAMAAKVDRDAKAADKAARRAATKARYDEKRRAGRAAQASVGTVNPPPDSPPEPPDKSYCVLSDASLEDAHAANITPGCARDDDGGEDFREESRVNLAQVLGVTPESIGWNAVELACSLVGTYGSDIVAAAARHCHDYGDRPVAYFVRSAESLCSETAAKWRADDAAEAARQRHAEEEAERRAEADRKRAEREAEEKRQREDRIIRNRIADFRCAAIEKRERPLREARQQRERAEREAARADADRLMIELVELVGRLFPAHYAPERKAFEMLNDRWHGTDQVRRLEVVRVLIAQTKRALASDPRNRL